MAVMTDEAPAGRVAERAGAAMRVAGAAMSLVLMVGVSVWGYRLFVRDMTGIPVVRAMAGPMREAPAEPGGQIAAHTGLAVNAVAALGEAAPPEDVLTLAPATAGLAPEDIQVQSMAEAGEVMAGDPEALLPSADETAVVQASADAASLVSASAASGTVAGTPASPVVLTVPDTAMTAAEVLALADMIAAGAAPLEPLAPVPVSAEAAAPVAAVAPVTADTADAPTGAETLAASPALPSAERISPDVPGVRVAWRPPARPGTGTGTGTAADGAEALPAAASLLSGPLQPGMPLVQLGAYETTEIAAADWEVIAQRFADFMGGKERVIQAAESGGESFVRLRASGFSDIEDANRFCAVLIAEGARCVPVVAE